MAGEGPGGAVAGGMSVVVHPLVLLSTVDHYNRVAKDTSKRVVGVLLGSSTKGVVDVTNSFAVPFEEDKKNPAIFFLDHSYLETMFRMYKKVNAREKIMGYYSTGPKIKENDIKIDDIMRRFCPNPVFVIIDVRPDVEGIPTTAYLSVEEVESDGKEIQRSFKHIPSSVGAFEAEEVGVEHLLRDVNDPSVSTLANLVKHKISGLTGLREQLLEMKTYLENVLTGKLPANNQIIYNMQTIFNLLPNLNVEELIRALLVKTNDMHLVIYISSLIRCIIALHNLVKNKIQYEDADVLAEKEVAQTSSGSKSKSKEEKAPQAGEKEGGGAG
eukprot:CAMPEP_0118965776 /NCGR_PEP_ID=MMETSP1173-20130426/3292_1 /TAXON_ID=1034831 /ORGANISM="Rhizochromulina marina cf, Strain CCMP1243" /LENGTH=327 /DNA_ID=CAMNT_0006914441 /DNA_START=22 /DNA_END=1001 /DNA_ORIENTATION=-